MHRSLPQSPIALLVASALACAAPAWAADPVLPADLAAGGTSRANPRSLTAIATAPSMIAMDRRYSLDLAGRFGADRELTGQAAISDSVTSGVALGLLFAYNRTIPSQPLPSELPEWKLPDERLESRRGRMTLGGALAGAFANGAVSAGLNVAYHRSGATYVNPEDVVDLGASLSFLLADSVYLTAGGENLLPHQTFEDAPARVGGGLRWSPDGRSGLEVDLLGDLDSQAPSPILADVGATAWMAEQFELSGGYRFSGVDNTNTVTAGFGFGSDKATLGYSFSSVVETWSEAFESQHGIGLRVDF